VCQKETAPNPPRTSPPTPTPPHTGTPRRAAQRRPPAPAPPTKKVRACVVARGAQPGVDVVLAHLVELGQAEGGQQRHEEQPHGRGHAPQDARHVERRDRLEGEGDLLTAHDAARHGWGVGVGCGVEVGAGGVIGEWGGGEGRWYFG